MKRYLVVFAVYNDTHSESSFLSCYVFVPLRGQMSWADEAFQSINVGRWPRQVQLIFPSHGDSLAAKDAANFPSMNYSMSPCENATEGSFNLSSNLIPFKLRRK